ncbi:MAG: oxidoreductase, FAD/FMN-binding [Firmicutes bacterium]|nr:oxidoreductase, FAD/FMN-binding [Bacillota bacterium]
MTADDASTGLGKESKTPFEQGYVTCGSDGGHRSLDIMNGLLNNEGISHFGMARPVICEPDLLKKWETGDFTAPKCVSCNQCFTTVGKCCILDKHKTHS